jgi:regulatory protein
MKGGVEQGEGQRALDLAYSAIATRERTEAELRAFLEKKRVDPGAIDAAVTELSRAGYLDDARYARRFAEDKRSLGRWGSERIERDLVRRGIAPEQVEAALAERAPQEELETALALLDERFARPLEGDRERARAWRFLVGRGYQPELAYDAVRQL